MNPPEANSEDVSRALAAFMRAEFLSPVEKLRGLIDILAEDAERAGLAVYGDDLGRMRQSGERLSELVSALLGSVGGAAAMQASVRHDLRTPVTAIIGYGELLAEEARERGDTALFSPLADCLEAASRLLKELDKVAVFVNSLGGDAGDPGARDATPDVLKQAIEAVRQLSRHEPAPSRALTGRLLVVDDNESMRDLISRRLSREGHEVATCGSGPAALRKAGSGGFDLMLLDLMMPGMSGLEVLDRLRTDPDTRSLPVIVMSALDELDTAVRCIEAGAEDFLAKPLNETLLRARISSLLDRKFLRDRELAALESLRVERARSDSLLRNVLPESVVERLAAGEAEIADHFDSVTVLFCDLVGFTALSARLPPAETLDLLNETFSGFDRLVEENGLEKIKTIGDSYMAVGGMFPPAEDHAGRVVRMASRMPEIVRTVGARHGLEVRIGIDTGSAVGGIIGHHKFFYDVWGDTVNTASRLENLAEPGRIHISQATRDALGDTVRSERREPIEVKGKGVMTTYYVVP